MLPICPRLAPENWPSAIVNPCPRFGDRLAVTLHVALLKVGRKAGEIFIIGQDRLGLGIPKVVVPDAEQPHDDGYILRKRGGAEIFIHAMRAGQQFLKVVHPNRQHNR